MINDKKIPLVTGSLAGLVTKHHYLERILYIYYEEEYSQKNDIEKITKSGELPLKILKLDVDSSSSVKNSIKKNIKKIRN